MEHLILSPDLLRKKHVSWQYNIYDENKIAHTDAACLLVLQGPEC